MDYTNLTTVNGIDFTPREIDILACISNINGRKNIGSLLGISSSTVAGHLRKIFVKTSIYCQSSIKNFLDKSDKVAELHKHYKNLLVQEEFGKILYQIAKIINNKYVVSCSINSSDCFRARFVLQSLQGAKINTLGSNPKLHIKLLDEISPNNLHQLHTVYISTEPLKQNYKNLTVFDCSSMERTYDSIFQIVKILLPKENLDELILKFGMIKSNILSENRYMKQDLTIEDKVNSTLISKSLKKYLLLLVGFLMAGVSLGYAISLQSKSRRVSNAVKPVTYFINHVNECKEIKDRLAKYGKVSIVSVSGIGKTQLARMFVGLNKKDYDLIWFFDALEDIDAEMQKLALKINELEGKKVIPDDSTTKEVMIYLQSKNNWLLVFDNLRIYTNSKVQKFIEWENNGHIIFCSQDSTNLPHPLQLSSFSQKDSDTLAKSILTDKDPSVVKFLTDNFKGHPMTIVLGAQIIDHTKGLSFDKYKEIILQDNSKVNNNIKIVLERIPPTARDLVQKIALINNQKFSLGMLKIISDNPDNLEQDMFTLSKFALVLQTTPDKDNPIFEMHDVVKGGILIQNLANKDMLISTIRKVTNAIPQSEESHLKLFDQDPSIQGNLEVMLENSERFNIPFGEVLKLRSSLMASYMLTLNYYECQKMADWLREKEEDNLVHVNNEDERVALSKYNLRIGVYEVFSKANFHEAFKRYEKAQTIIQEVKDYPELKFDILAETAQTAIWGGDVKNAEEKMIEAEKLIVQYPQAALDKVFYWFIKSKIELVKGNSIEALQAINHSIKLGENIPLGQYIGTVLSLKAEILNSIQKYDEAYQISKTLYDREIGNKKPNHEFHARILTPLAEAENNIGQTKIALRHIEDAREVFSGIRGVDSNFITNTDYASALVVKGDILLKLNKSKEAVDAYLKAVGIFANRYGLNFGKTPNISYLLLQGIKACEQAKDSKNLEYFQSIFKKYFTLTN